MGKKKKLKEPVVPVGLNNPVITPTIPQINVTGGATGITNSPSAGTTVGIYGLEPLKQASSKTQQQLNDIIPTLGQVTQSDTQQGSAVADNMFQVGKALLDSELSRNIKNSQEDAFNRGLGASSSFVDALRGIYEANANAVGKLKSDSSAEGMKYAWDLANNRLKAFQALQKLNSDTYDQINKLPLQLGSAYSIPQADLAQNTQQLNSENLANYYKIMNQGIADYNDSLVKQKSQKNSVFGNLFSKILPF